MDPNYSQFLADDQKPTMGSQFIEFIQTLVVFAAIGTVIYLFIAQPHKVSGPSMFPTFKDGDYIITDKVSYHLGEPKRGDVIVFKNPQDESQDFIKRIMGVPGDRIKVENNKVYINGEEFPEPYLQPSVMTRNGDFLSEGTEVTVTPGHFLVFGDNRPQSSDSREWGFITKEEILGKVFIRYWPPAAMAVNPGAAN